MTYPSTMYRATGQSASPWEFKTINNADDEAAAREEGFIDSDQKRAKEYRPPAVPQPKPQPQPAKVAPKVAPIDLKSQNALVASGFTFPRTITGVKISRKGVIDVVELAHDGGSTFIKFKQGVCKVGGDTDFDTGTVLPT